MRIVKTPARRALLNAPMLALAASTLLTPIPATAQATAVVRGQVIDETGAAIIGVQVTLTDAQHSGQVMVAATRDDGGYVFFQVPFEIYQLTAQMEGFQIHQQTLDVHSVALTANITLKVGVVAERVEVAASAIEESHVSTLTHMEERQLIRKAGAAPARLIESAILESGGVTQNANGRMHIRGAHYQISFMIDGLPVSDQLSIDFGNPFDVRNVEAMEIYTGNFPAEYGNKVSGVVNVSTKSGIGSGKKVYGSVSSTVGSFGALDGAAQFGGGTYKWGYFVSVAGGRTDRFLDPPTFANLHNGGGNQSLFSRFDLAPTQKDFLNFSINAAHSRFDVPNLPSQDASGQVQEQELADISVRLHWLHLINSRWTMEIVPYYRTAVAELFSSPGDTPVTASQARHLTTAGGKWTVSYNAGAHRFKSGVDVFAFPVSEFLTFGITHADFNNPLDPDYNVNLADYDLTPCDVVRIESCDGTLFLFDGARTGKEYSFFVQDEVHWKGLTATLGLRYDDYNFILDEDHWSPRLGIAYRIGPSDTVVRASYNRLFQTPSNENLVFSTSSEAGALVPPDRIDELGAALLIIRPERVDFWEVAVEQHIRDAVEVELSYYTKRIDDFHDNDQLLNTTIVFPAAIRKGEVDGADLRVSMPPHRGLFATWMLSWGKTIGLPPLSGGLFLGEEALDLLTSGPFHIDHDQTWNSQGSFNYEHGSGVWTGFSGRYDSGTPVEIDDLAAVQANPDLNEGLEFIDMSSPLFRVSSRTIFNWSIGYDHPKEDPKVSLQFNVLNLTDQRRLFNFLSVFSGTHVVAPRSASARLQYRF